ncbi:MAG: ABC transporter permease [Phascolarctobacterium sp.]|nr:ABC transporter permease [Phascolarctobacterium sp.]MBQ7020797.1 ABC transporter permease [Phascolarctobacterium sp.]
MTGFIRRLKALVSKEFKQLLRDNSSLMIGIAVPIILIFLMGYGISMDVKRVPTAVVVDDPSPTVEDMLSFMEGSEYFFPYYPPSMKDAVALMDSRTVDAIVRIPSDFTESLYQHRANIQIILYGVDASNANVMKGYLEGGINGWLARNQQKFMGSDQRVGAITVVNRMWFNDANTSTWYFIPGLIVLVITISGVFLTSMVMAKEWERGTLEALFVTPVKVLEILLSKMIPYFCVAMVGFSLCVAASQLLFDVPMHGSFIIILLCTMLYLFVALGVGLMISSITKNQFLASQMALVLSMMPTMMLSGFLFDLRSVPLVVKMVGYALPPTYYMQLLKTLFLAGNNWSLILKNCTILVLYAIFFISMAFRVTQKRVE